MDKLDCCLIPFVYLIRMTLSLLSLLVFFTRNFPTHVRDAVTNTTKWIAIICIHLILFSLSATHRIVQFGPIQFTLNLLIQSPVVQTILFWPRFYYSIMKPKENRRTLWQILRNPVPVTGPKAAKRIFTVWQPGGTNNLIRNKIVCLNQNMHCLSHYQVKGAFAHLNQKAVQDLDEALAAACAITYYDDPLHLAVPYIFFMDLLPEPPDGCIKSSLFLTLILFVYLFPIFKALLKHWTTLLLSRIILSDDRNVFVRYGRRKRKTKRVTCLHIRLCATDADPGDSPFSWDTDGIAFIIDNSATVIISNERKLFTGPLVPIKVTLETAKGVSTQTKFGE